MGNRLWLLVFLPVLLCFPALSPAQTSDQAAYRIEIPSKVVSTVREKGGKNTRIVSLQFQIKRVADQAVVTTIPREEIRVHEDGLEVLNLEILQPGNKPLTVVLALDISRSMELGDKISKAKAAALSFLDKLDDRSNVGLILFDHEIRVAEMPTRNAEGQREHRERLRGLIRDAKPTGATAYLDAAVKAVSMLKDFPGRRAAVVMTDGADTNSSQTLEQAIAASVAAEVPIYTVGIGEPGKNDPVTTVLVLDRSGSMLGKADDTDDRNKMDALKQAAKRFVDLMRPSASTTVLSFSSQVDPVEDFSSDRVHLKQRIEDLSPAGGTHVYDATFTGLNILEARKATGRRAVVVLTDGKDESEGSRRSEDLIIEEAKRLGVPLYMLGLGRPGEINEPVMRKMADSTGGQYYHAGNQQKLLEVFESLSIKLHDEGIDEKSLRELAERTGGKYTHVSDMSKLQIIYEQIADELQSSYKVTFESRRPSHDGTARGIDVSIYQGGKVVSTGGRTETVVRGIVVPQMNYVIFLGFLALLSALLAVPGMLQRLTRGTPT